ncbi:3-oxoacyl-ACP reductase family protein [Acidicapsa ligni]|uniref:3-oxoacyl-ACP reductase family protein n=1 Tax=Acidicapsa ligni TaxID=542300 RepID=UPI0021E0956C|nr:3-oxoacyl-ACP reductase family protein [Acidicapsa ligni]
MESTHIDRHAGSIALVTGGSRGIGAGIVRRLASDGVSVAFTYSSSEDKALQLVNEIESTGGSALAIKADSASADEVRLAVTKAVSHFGPLDIFVSNAGILTRGSIGDLSLEDLDRMLAINVRAVVVGIQAAAATMNDGGRIITIGSVVAVRTGFPGSSIYSMTKAAIVGLVRGVAIDLAPRAITVNNIQPGPIATDMNPADGPHVDMLHTLIPLRRYGKDAEVASLVSYLTTKDAAFITGASLTVDGGYSA